MEDKKDNLKTLFDRVIPSLEMEEVPQGHTNRFADRLNNHGTAKTLAQKRFPWKSFSIAASVIILLGLGVFILKPATPIETGLASVSPEMEQTQSFFITTINQELDKIKNIETAESKTLVEDALDQLAILEKEYSKLKTDLKASGNDKRVIYAMITNFQNRIEILQSVVAQIEEINNFKNNKNETII